MELWNLDELVAQVALGLSGGDYGGAASGRVRDLPDARAIRYYTTLGILDRPAMQGRTAFYGVRHLRQIVAIKKLQSRGWPLARVQQELAGIDDGALKRIAELPAALEVVASNESRAAIPAAPRSRKAGSFWTEPPIGTGTKDGIFAAMPMSEPAAKKKDAADAKQVEAETGSAPTTNAPPASMQGLKLGDHAMLLIQAARALEAGDLDAITAAAAPLLALLEKRGLLTGKEPKR